MAGTDPPLIDLPLMVKSCAPVRLITGDAVYGEDGVVAAAVVVVVDGELAETVGLAVVVAAPPDAGAGVTVGAGVPVTGVVEAVVPVAVVDAVPVAVDEVVEDEAVEVVVAGAV